jgi:hypothetical protein
VSASHLLELACKAHAPAADVEFYLAKARTQFELELRAAEQALVAARARDVAQARAWSDFETSRDRGHPLGVVLVGVATEAFRAYGMWSFRIGIGRRPVDARHDTASGRLVNPQRFCNELVAVYRATTDTSHRAGRAKRRLVLQFEQGERVPSYALDLIEAEWMRRIDAIDPIERKP